MELDSDRPVRFAAWRKSMEQTGGHLTEEEQDRIRTTIDEYALNVPWWLVNRQRDLQSNEDAHIIGTEVRLTRDDDVARLASIKTYRGYATAADTRSEVSAFEAMAAVVAH